MRGISRVARQTGVMINTACIWEARPSPKDATRLTSAGPYPPLLARPGQPERPSMSLAPSHSTHCKRQRPNGHQPQGREGSCGVDEKPSPSAQAYGGQARQSSARHPPGRLRPEADDHWWGCSHGGQGDSLGLRPNRSGARSDAGPEMPRRIAILRLRAEKPVCRWYRQNRSCSSRPRRSSYPWRCWHSSPGRTLDPGQTGWWSGGRLGDAAPAP